MSSVLALGLVLCRHGGDVVVTGRPGVGKTFAVENVGMSPLCVAPRAGRVVLHTDGFRNVPWEHQPDAILGAVASLHGASYLMEGIAAGRMLRHGLRPEAVFVLMGRDRTDPDPAKSRQRTQLGERVYKWVAEAKEKLPATKFYYYDWTTGETNVH